MRSFILATSAIAVLFSNFAFSHQGHHHHPGAERHVTKPDPTQSAAFEKIREVYQSKVEPIFQKSCMDCHSNKTVYPWYYKVPVVKQLIDSDIREAQSHLDFMGGYPFKSHATPIEDLDAIAESVTKGTMPPWKYRIFHPDSVLHEDEKKAILDWVDESKKILKN